MSAPLSKPEKANPKVLIKGLIALRKTCLNITTSSRTPFARAVTTKPPRIVSIKLARMIRMILAIDPIPRASVGRIK